MPQKHSPTEAPAGPVPPAGGARLAETLVLLTRDESLIEALASVVAADTLMVVADEAALAHQLMNGHAGVAFIDAGAGQFQPGVTAQLAQRLHNQLPDVVLVVTGDGAAQSELAALVADGTIYRFVHKPVSAQRVKLFVDAAWRKRDGTSGASGVFPALNISQPPPSAPTPAKIPKLPTSAIAAGVAAIGAAVAWFVLHSNSPKIAGTPAPAAAPSAVHRTAPAPVAPAPVVAPDSAPTGAAADLDRLATAAEQALLAGNLAEATRLTDAARAVDPDHVRVKFLTTQIAREQARENARRRLAEMADAAPQPPHAAAAKSPPAVSVPSASPAVPTPASSTAAAAPAPAAAASSPNVAVNAATGVSNASSPAAASAPSSTPPVSEAKDHNSVAAVILQRIHSVDPVFPEEARERDLTGYVDLEFTVRWDGVVEDVTVLKSQPLGIFDQAAVAAVKQWRYRPVQRNGVPVNEHARLRLNFAYK
jgi:TonB family protein